MIIQTNLFFWDKVLVGDSTDCWEWIAGKCRDGYGTFEHSKVSIGAHRFAWQFFNGTIPPGTIIRHSCDNPACVNPEHLLPGTHKDNMRDRDSRGRNGSTNLTEDDVRKIRSLSKTMPKEEIAKLFKKSRSRIYDIVGGKRFKWVA